jgi:hypothetical protein
MEFSLLMKRFGSGTVLAPGFNVGGGLAFRLGDSTAHLYAEVRYHRAFNPKYGNGSAAGHVRRSLVTIRLSPLSDLPVLNVFANI